MYPIHPKVDTYLIEGCGRCPHYRTPQCKVHLWTEELKELRRIVLECGLREEYKWSQPCYTIQKKNVLIVTAFKDYAVVAFFKGTLLKDSHNLLVAPGKHSQASRQLRYTDVRDILEKETIIKSYIQQAIEVEKAGSTVKFNKAPLSIPEELVQKFGENPALKKAFEALSPGRRRGYILFFSQAKQTKTRRDRIEKWVDSILNGEGMNDAYRLKKK